MKSKCYDEKDTMRHRERQNESVGKKGSWREKNLYSEANLIET
jgi:hypothetical protein